MLDWALVFAFFTENLATIWDVEVFSGREGLKKKMLFSCMVEIAGSCVLGALLCLVSPPS